jgi:hypothetical protein
MNHHAGIEWPLVTVRLVAKEVLKVMVSLYLIDSLIVADLQPFLDEECAKGDADRKGRPSVPFSETGRISFLALQTFVWNSMIKCPYE